MGRKLSMLDVLVAGVALVVMAGRIYEEQGVVVKVEVGLAFLFAAEVCHYLCYYAVTSMPKSGGHGRREDSNNSVGTLGECLQEDSEEESSEIGGDQLCYATESDSDDKGCD